MTDRENMPEEIWANHYNTWGRVAQANYRKYPRTKYIRADKVSGSQGVDVGIINNGDFRKIMREGFDKYDVPGDIADDIVQKAIAASQDPPSPAFDVGKVRGVIEKAYLYQIDWSKGVDENVIAVQDILRKALQELHKATQSQK